MTEPTNTLPGAETLGNPAPVIATASGYQIKASMNIEYKVGTFRAAGLEARWGKHSGTPFILLRNPNAKLEHQRKTWWTCDRTMFERMQKVGIVEAFDEHTLLGDIFAI